MFSDLCKSFNFSHLRTVGAYILNATLKNHRKKMLHKRYVFNPFIVFPCTFVCLRRSVARLTVMLEESVLSLECLLLMRLPRKVEIL